MKCCPFCHGKELQELQEFGRFDAVCIECKVCGCQGPRVKLTNEETLTIQDSLKYAWNIWNERPLNIKWIAKVRKEYAKPKNKAIKSKST